VTKAKFIESAPIYTVAVAIGSDLNLWFADLERIGFHRDEIMDLAVDRKAGLLATGSRDGRARVWSLYPSNPFLTTFRPPEQQLAANAVALNANGSMLAVAASNARINARGERESTHASLYIVDTSTGQLLQPPLEGHHKAIVNLAFSYSGMLASASDDGTVLLWDLAKRSFRTILSGGRGALHVEFSPDGHLLVFTQANGPAGIWDVERGAWLWHSQANDVVAVTFSPDGTQLAMGTTKGEVRLRALSQEKDNPALALESHGEVVRLAYDRTGGRLVALSQGKPYLVETTNQAARLLAAAGQQVRDFAITTSALVLLDYSGRLSLWDLHSEERIADLHWASGDYFIPRLQSVAASADGSRIAVTLPGGVTIFNLSNAALESRACSIAGEPLTPAEWAAMVQTPYTSVCQNH
jgi:WD40 repeat protein